MSLCVMIIRNVRHFASAFQMEMTDVREDLAALRREMASLSKVVAGAVVRLEQAVIEERTTRQTVVEELRQEVRRRAAPSGRPQG